MSSDIKTRSAQGTVHFGELDGLRGAAAFIVMFAHYWYFLFRLDETAVGESPLGAFFNSKYAVYLFFTLSGFVLAHAASHSRLGFGRLLVKRYLRLTVPMLASVAIAFVLFKLGLGSESYRTAVSPEAVSYFAKNFDPSVWFAVYDTAIRTYVTGDSSLNPVLWTMRIELIGSIAVFVFYRFIPHRKYRLPLNAIAAIAGFALLGKHHPISGLQLFACGMIMYDIWPELARFRNHKPIGNGVGIALLMIAFVLVAWWADNPSFPSIAPLFDALKPVVKIDRYEAWQAAAVISLLGVLVSPASSRLFASPPLRFSGAISFPLYLTHTAVIVMVVGHVFLWLQGYMSPMSAALLLWIPSIALCMLVSMAFLRFAERPAIRLSTKAGNWRLSATAYPASRGEAAGHIGAE